MSCFYRYVLIVDSDVLGIILIVYLDLDDFDMPAGHGHMTLEFSVSAWLVNGWYPTASISDLLVVVMKKATAGITIS
ncbi:hypothetical protein DOP65_24300 [Shigella sonnei]|nr:hypothetical protein [Shigella sonnei]